MVSPWCVCVCVHVCMCLKEIKVFKKKTQKTGSKELPDDCRPLEDADTHTCTFEVFLASSFCWGRSEMKVSHVFFPTWGVIHLQMTPSVISNPRVFGWGPPVLQEQRAATGHFRTLVYSQNQHCGEVWALEGKGVVPYGNPRQTKAFATYQSPLVMGQGPGWVL